MSTRSIVVIRDYWMNGSKKVEREVTLYHHYDGYPSGVGKFLMEKIYPKLTRSNIDGKIIANNLIKDKDDNGFEFTWYTHSDTEYKYVIDVPAKSIHCYKGHYPSWDRADTEPYEFEISEEIDLTEFISKGMKESYA